MANTAGHRASARDLEPHLYLETPLVARGQRLLEDLTADRNKGGLRSNHATLRHEIVAMLAGHKTVLIARIRTIRQAT